MSGLFLRQFYEREKECEKARTVIRAFLIYLLAFYLLQSSNLFTAEKIALTEALVILELTPTP